MQRDSSLKVFIAIDNKVIWSLHKGSFEMLSTADFLLKFAISR